jgi:hypothetical protein
MTIATGTFEVQPGNEATLDGSGDDVRLTHAPGRQRFSGSIVGDGRIDWLMCYLPTKEARYVGLQRISGTIDGRHGSVVLEAVGSHDGTGSSSTWRIIEGSGTDQLAGIRGEGGFKAAGGKTVEYRLSYEIA